MAARAADRNYAGVELRRDSVHGLIYPVLSLDSSQLVSTRLDLSLKTSHSSRLVSEDKSPGSKDKYLS